jgi:hypothetical protein
MPEKALRHFGFAGVDRKKGIANICMDGSRNACAGCIFRLRVMRWGWRNKWLKSSQRFVSEEVFYDMQIQKPEKRIINRDAGKEKVNPNCSRRGFIKAASFTVGATGALSVCGLAPAQSGEKPKGLPISIAGYKFDRTVALIDGRMKVEGCEITSQESGIGDINTNVFSGPQTLDVTEIGLHPFMLAYANDGFRDYSLLPIFPLRLFRH